MQSRPDLEASARREQLYDSTAVESPMVSKKYESHASWGLRAKLSKCIEKFSGGEARTPSTVRYAAYAKKVMVIARCGC